MKGRVRCKTCMHLRKRGTPHWYRASPTLVRFGAAQVACANPPQPQPIFSEPLSREQISAWRKCDRYEPDVTKVLLELAEQDDEGPG